MKLYEIPQDSKLMVRVNGGAEKRPATFHHIDGSYSLCTLDEAILVEDSRMNMFHLNYDEEMVAVGDPITHYELAGDR